MTIIRNFFVNDPKTSLDDWCDWKHYKSIDICTNFLR